MNAAVAPPMVVPAADPPAVVLASVDADDEAAQEEETAAYYAERNYDTVPELQHGLVAFLDARDIFDGILHRHEMQLKNCECVCDVCNIIRAYNYAGDYFFQSLSSFLVLDQLFKKREKQSQATAAARDNEMRAAEESGNWPPEMKETPRVVITC